MRPSSNTVYIQQNYSQSRSIPRQFVPQINANYLNYQQSNFGTKTQRQSQKTQQRQIKRVSSLAINAINQQIYQIINMDNYEVDANLRKSARNIYGLINNDLLLNVKRVQNMKLLLYNTILMYIDQASRNHQQRIRQKSRQKPQSISSSKNVSNLQEKDIAITSAFNPYSINQLQNLKQTVPFIPKDKSKTNKNIQADMLEQQLTDKIQSTKISLENILKKIQHYNNYRLSGEDIMRLKKSVANVSQLKPSNFLNLHSMNPTSSMKQKNNSIMSRPQSRQHNDQNKTKQTFSGSRPSSKSKTYNGSFGNSKAQEIPSGDQGNQLLMQQLEQIIQRKQNRIRQLTKQLTKNLSDQKQLQGTIQNFEIQIQEIQNQRKNFQQIIQKLQQQNLNYQIQIKQIKEAELVRIQAQKPRQALEGDTNTFKYLKQFQTRQKILKFSILKYIQYNLQVKQSQQKWKDTNSLSGGSAFNDISQITPKRQSKKILLPQDIDQEYAMQNNTITTRRHPASDKRDKSKSKDRSFNKFQIMGEKTQNRLKTENVRQEFKQLQKQTFQKILFLQALTIEQLLQDM